MSAILAVLFAVAPLPPDPGEPVEAWIDRQIEEALRCWMASASPDPWEVGPRQGGQWDCVADEIDLGDDVICDDWYPPAEFAFCCGFAADAGQPAVDATASLQWITVALLCVCAGLAALTERQLHILETQRRHLPRTLPFTFTPAPRPASS